MIKKIAKRAGYVLAAAVVVAAAWALYVDVTGIPKYEVKDGDIPTMKVEITPARIERGAKFAKMLCAECHLDPATQRMTGKYMGDGLARFGNIWSKNITKDPEHGIGNWTDGELAYFLRQQDSVGVAGYCEFDVVIPLVGGPPGDTG